MRRLSSHFRRSAAFEAYLAPAQAFPALWRLLLGLICIALSVLCTGLAVGVVGRFLEYDQAATTAFLRLTTPIGAILVLGSFSTWLIGLWLAARIIHRRRLRSLVGPINSIRLPRYAAGAGGALTLSAIGLLIYAAAFDAPIAWGKPPGVWVLAAVAALPAIFVQTAVEEMAFRGYLTQQLAVRFRSAWVWAGAPSLLFGLLHWNPAGYGDVALAVVFVTGLTGLAFTAITVRTGDLSTAMGAHFGLNVFALTIVSPANYASGLAYWRWPADQAVMSRLIWFELSAIALILLAAAVIFRPSPPAG